MSITKFASLPLNSAGTMVNNFSLDSMLNISPTWCLPLQHSSPCTYISERRPQSHPNCQGQLLGYWLKPMTIFEKMHEEEIKIVYPLFLITDSWLWAPVLCKVPQTLRGAGDAEGGSTQFFRHEPTVFPSLLAWEYKPPSDFLQTLSLYFLLASLSQESKVFGLQEF